MDVESEFEKHRFKTWLTKEPETISWIEQFFEKGDIFYDIGANIGVYSLFAKALHKDDIEVYSFEPAYHNFAKLCKNIIVNDFTTGCFAYPLAFNERTQLETIELASTISGSAMHIMKGSVEARDDFKTAFTQGVMSVSLDDLVSKFSLPVPHHIKIDTDGLEEQIVRGGTAVFQNNRVKSILIEISNDDASGKYIIATMEGYGFNKDHPINTGKNHSRIRREQEGSTFENIIFTRS
jgi:FkbM family methyltransferase